MANSPQKTRWHKDPLFWFLFWLGVTPIPMLIILYGLVSAVHGHWGTAAGALLGGTFLAGLVGHMLDLVARKLPPAPKGPTTVTSLHDALTKTKFTDHKSEEDDL